MQPTNHQPTGTPDVLSALTGAGAIAPRDTEANDEANELLAELEDGIASIFAELHAAEAAGTADNAPSAAPADGGGAVARADASAADGVEAQAEADTQADGDADAQIRADALDQARAEAEVDTEAEVDAEAVAKADLMTQHLLGELDRLWQRHAA